MKIILSVHCAILPTHEEGKLSVTQSSLWHSASKKQEPSTQKAASQYFPWKQTALCPSPHPSHRDSNHIPICDHIHTPPAEVTSEMFLMVWMFHKQFLNGAGASQTVSQTFITGRMFHIQTFTMTGALKQEVRGNGP